MGKAEDGERLSIRLTPELTKRMDRVQPKIAKHPNMAGLMRITRSDVVRLALLRGLDALEKEYR